MISWLPVYAYIALYCVLSACKSLAKLAKIARDYYNPVWVTCDVFEDLTILSFLSLKINLVVVMLGYSKSKSCHEWFSGTCSRGLGFKESSGQLVVGYSPFCPDELPASTCIQVAPGYIHCIPRGCSAPCMKYWTVQSPTSHLTILSWPIRYPR